MKIRLLFFCCLLSCCLNAQEPLLSIVDSSTSHSWTRLANPHLSNDRNYFSYDSVLGQYPSITRIRKVKNLNNNESLEFRSIKDLQFSDDSRQVFYLTERDSLFSMNLLDRATMFIDHCVSFERMTICGESFLFYRTIIPNAQLCFWAIKRQKKVVFPGVSDYSFDRQHTRIVIQSMSNNTWVTQLVSFPSFDSRTILQKGKSHNFIFDSSGERLAFLVSPISSERETDRLFYFSGAADSARELNVNEHLKSDPSIRIAELLHFTASGKGIFIKLAKTITAKTRVLNSPAIWHYQDARFRSEEKPSIQQVSSFAYLNIAMGTVSLLTDQAKRESRAVFFNKESISERVLIVEEPLSAHQEIVWNVKSIQHQYFVSPGTAQRTEFPMRVIDVSPDGRYVIFEDAARKDFCSYLFQTGILSNLTKRLSTPLTNSNDDQPHTNPRFYVAGWIKSATLLFNDEYDIWSIDLDNPANITCLTGGQGRASKTVFQIVQRQPGNFNGDEMLVLHSFNQKNKNTGFFNLDLSKGGRITQLSTGPNEYENDQILSLWKQKPGDLSIVPIANVANPVNYYVTRDYKSFHQVTFNYPQRKYNWPTSELFNWKTHNGVSSSAIIYKPKDFDPLKKYPVIFHYYDKESDELNRQLYPDLTGDIISIPWFVSRGYIVVLPDFHYKLGHVGESVLDCMVSLVAALGKYAWIDKKHMGIQGHSFGGFETNYLISHTNLFAAAVSASGVVDLMSVYGSTWSNGTGWQEYLESRRIRMGAIPWERPDWYIKNSPVFNLNNVHTPVLLMNNKNDAATPFVQGIEFFADMRRLGKRIWLMQYENEVHSLLKEENKYDYTKRMTQFFDHYLKDSAAPRWLLYENDHDKRYEGTEFDLIREKDKKGRWLTPEVGKLLVSKEQQRVSKITDIKNRITQ